jgi:hypothetical protein
VTPSGSHYISVQLESFSQARQAACACGPSPPAPALLLPPSVAAAPAVVVGLRAGLSCATVEDGVGVEVEGRAVLRGTLPGGGGTAVALRVTGSIVITDHTPSQHTITSHHTPHT